MVVEYRRDLEHNYMLIREEAPCTADAYELRTLMSNRIPGLLTMDSDRINEVTFYRYDITSCQPFQAICGSGRLSAEILRDLYVHLLESLMTFEDYLLDSSHLLFDPGCLFVRWDERTLQLPYVPFYNRGVRESMIALTEEILMQVMSGRQDAIVLSCRILHKLQEKDVQLSEIRRFLEEDRQAAQSSGIRTDGKDLMPAGCGSDAFAADAFRSDGIRTDAFRTNAFRTDASGTDAFRPDGFMPDDLPAQAGALPLRGAAEPDRDPQPADDSHDLKKRNGGIRMHAGKPAKRKNRISAAVRKQAAETLPEKATVRMMLLAALPAGGLFIFLHLTDVFLLSTEEAAGVSILAAAASVMLCRVLAARHKGRRGSMSEKEEDPGAAFDDLQDDELSALMSGDLAEEAETEVRENDPDEFLPLYASEERFDSDEEEFGHTMLLSDIRAQRGGSSAVLMPLDGNRHLSPIPVTGREVLIGKQHALVDAVIPSDAVSRMHARIFRKNGMYYISDLGSKNGTAVDGRHVVGRDEVPLTENAQVAFADCLYVFRTGGA